MATTLDYPGEAVYGPMVAEGFQDVSSGNCAVQALRHDVFGITVYFDHSSGKACEPGCHRANYVIAYESELRPEEQLTQIIVETNEAAGIWRLLHLVNTHAERIEREIETVFDINGIQHEQLSMLTFIESLNLSDLGGFEDERIRDSIMRSLEGICDYDPGSDAYAGFENAVLSTVDDWLMSKATSNSEDRARTVTIEAENTESHVSR